MKKRGIGYGCMIYAIGYGFGRPDNAGVYLEMAEDGTVTVLSGGADMGQGLTQMLALVVAEEIGLRQEDVRVINADTAFTPDSGASSASRQTYISGQAALKAASQLKETILKMASEMLHIHPEQIILRQGGVYMNGVTERRLELRQVAAECHRVGLPCLAWGWHSITTPDVDPETSQGDAHATYIFATQSAEVEVDTETGEVSVLRLVAAHDLGKVVNLLAAEGQVEGGCSMGVGYALSEEVLLKNGIPLTPSLSEYLIPTALDMPSVIPLLIEDPDPTGPFGAKGLGEGAAIPCAPAIVNAIYNAVGIRLSSLPVTADKILAALWEQGHSNVVGS
jgi:CO/xanthine dehydrogenase Mo-binding subunit